MATALLLLTPAAALAGTGAINDPLRDQKTESGDRDRENVDVSRVNIENGARTITVKVSFNNLQEIEPGVYPERRTTVSMKWGSGPRRTCKFSETFVGPAGQCGGDMPLLQRCGSIGDGRVQVFTIPRRCVSSAADNLQFKVVSVYQETVCMGCDELDRTRDTTDWSRVIRRG